MHSRRSFFKIISAIGILFTFSNAKQNKKSDFKIKNGWILDMKD